jgi:hypothetical protein
MVVWPLEPSAISRDSKLNRKVGAKENTETNDRHSFGHEKE